MKIGSLSQLSPDLEQILLLNDLLGWALNQASDAAAASLPFLNLVLLRCFYNAEIKKSTGDE